MPDITHTRMHSQHLAGVPCETPEEVVRRLGAIQSQDFGPAKWSIAQRTGGVTDEAMDQAFAAGTILRTHVLRPTWHFVLPADIRWMLELTAPRVLALNASYYRHQDLDGDILKRCNAALTTALRGGQHLTRGEIAHVLEQSGIPTDSLRLGAILMNAELIGVVCSGAPRGKQRTYGLLEERAPWATRLSREEALAELTLRYFTGHGPASVNDLRWWSSLPVVDINEGLAMVSSQLEHEVVDGITYWFAPTVTALETVSSTVHLVQGYDEYIVGYSESKYVLDVSGIARSLPRSRGIYTHAVILDGQVAGQWKPVRRTRGVTVEVTLFGPHDAALLESLHLAVERYGAFLGLPVALKIS